MNRSDGLQDAVRFKSEVKRDRAAAERSPD